MLLDQIDKSWNAVSEIGREAGEKARALGVDPSFADEDYARQRAHAAKALAAEARMASPSGARDIEALATADRFRRR